jgi:AbrB family looped-hinge helix DNA binding protein
MTQEVVITRKGQTTIPIELRRKYGLEEGSKLEVHDTGRGILLKPKPSLLDMLGTDSDVATAKEMKQLLDKMRAEDA